MMEIGSCRNIQMEQNNKKSIQYCFFILRCLISMRRSTWNWPTEVLTYLFEMSKFGHP